MIPPQPDQPISVALFGGGRRATIESTGVIRELVARGMNREIAQISSISGGSIINTVLAHRKADLRTISSNGIDEIARDIDVTNARRGLLVSV